MTVIRSRSEWTSTKEGFTVPLYPSRVKGIVIHYPGSGDSVINAGKSDEYNRQKLRDYRNYHVVNRGWPDIGYNLAIGQTGSAWWAAGKKKAAHCASTANPHANADYFGIVLLVGNKERPTDAMRTTLYKVFEEVFDFYPRADESLLGHRQVYGAQTACPGDLIISMIQNETLLLNPTAVESVPIVVPPAPKTNTNAHRSYKKGEVARIQEILKELGYYKGNIDDDYGPWTEAAVKLYQKSQLFGNLVADGDWGPRTEAHYLWVIRLQKTMNQWKGADIAVDGDYRRFTANRVEDLMRRNHGFTYHGHPDGVPGPVFCRMLGIPTHP